MPLPLLFYLLEVVIMAEINNATCSICGREYYKCISCKDLINLNPWKRYTDTSEHYKIYQILHGFNTNVYTKEEAKLKLQIVDLSDFDSLRDNIKNIIIDIMGKDETIVNSVEETESTSLQIESNVSDECIEENFIFDKSKAARKRKSFKVVETE